MARATFAPHAHPPAGDPVRRPDHRGLAARRSGRAGARDLEDQVHRIDRDRATGAVCGLGPELEVDGRVYPTAVTGTLGAVLDGTPLTVSGCGRAGAAVRRRRTGCASAPPTSTPPPGSRCGPSTPAGAVTAGGRAPSATSRCAAGRPAGASSTWRPARRRSCVCRRTSTPAGGPRSTGDELDAGARRRLDAGLPAARGRRRPGDAGLRARTGSTRPGSDSVACWRCCSSAAAVVVGRRETAVVACWPTPGRATLAGAAPWAWRWRLPALVAGAVLGGPAFAAGLLLGDLGRRRIGDPGAVGAVLVGAGGRGRRRRRRASSAARAAADLVRRAGRRRASGSRPRCS